MKRFEKDLLAVACNRLRALQEQRGLSVEEATKATRLPVSAIEAGEKDIAVDRLGLLCDYYEVSLVAFFKDVEQMMG